MKPLATAAMLARLKKELKKNENETTDSEYRNMMMKTGTGLECTNTRPTLTINVKRKEVIRTTPAQKSIQEAKCRPVETPMILATSRSFLSFSNTTDLTIIAHK